MAEIEVLKEGELRPGPATPGIVRKLAFEGKDALLLHSTAEGGAITAWHHHSDHDIYGFLISGTLRFDYGPGGRQSADIKAGEYFHMPPRIVHRDVNPSKDEMQDAIVVITGTGPLVVNLDGPED